MGKIDLDKFISSLIVHCKENRGPVSRWLEDSLADQCLRFDGDDLVEAVQTPKWYKCIKECRGFFVGRLYCTNEYGDLFTDPESEYKFGINISNPYYSGWFCPATEEEIEEISGNNGGISPNSEDDELATLIQKSMDFMEGRTSIIEELKRRDKTERLQFFYNQGYEAGEAEALKDMPKWKKNLDIKTAFGISCERYDFIEYQDLYLKVADLIEKLPKEE